MESEDRFWDLAEEHLATRVGVTRSTMMGFPCRRINGDFFASFDRRNGHLVVKLPAARIADLVATGDALTFAPAGRTFREWAAIPASEPERWREWLRRR